MGLYLTGFSENLILNGIFKGFINKPLRNFKGYLVFCSVKVGNLNNFSVKIFTLN